MNLKTEYVPISLPDIVGKGYATYWNFKGRYRVVKGSRASKKSKTTALWYIYNLMKYPQANLMVVRKTYSTIKDSCYTELQWAIHRLNVDSYFKFKLNPLEITYLPTGQSIYFRGLDDPLKITSIAVDVGVLCWVWLEEAYEVMKEASFDILDESIRGECPNGLFKQFTITFNPWNERHWLKKRFFDVKNDNVLAMTTNYLCNEWLDEQDKQLFNEMKIRNPRRYQVAGLGNWGISEGVIYENWKEEDFKLVTSEEFRASSNKENLVIKDKFISCCGLDFGYTNDPSAFIAIQLDKKNKKIYIVDEFYKKGLSNKKIFDEVCLLGYKKERIRADSAEPKSIDELYSLGLRIEGAKKGRDSINNGIQWIQECEIIVKPHCVNFLTEISNYTWASDKFGKKINVPIDDFNHLMDAMRYGLEEFIINSRWLF